MRNDSAGSGLDDLLADGLIQAMMTADKVDPNSIRILIRTVARQREIEAFGRDDRPHTDRQIRSQIESEILPQTEVRPCQLAMLSDGLRRMIGILS